MKAIISLDSSDASGAVKTQMKIKRTQTMYTYHIKEMMFVSTCRKTFIKFSLYSGVLLIAVAISIVPYFLNTTQKPLEKHRISRYATDLKYILFWNQPKEVPKTFQYHEKLPDFVTGQSLFIKQKCKYINCYVTYDKNLLRNDNNFDAVVFDIQEIRHLNPEQLNLSRSPHQKYVFKSHESSEKYPICYPFYENFFNWTWTYKLNSDIPHPFLNIYDENNTMIGPKRGLTWLKSFKRIDRFKKKLEHKHKAVAWIVGQCKLKTKHKIFISQLQKELKGYNYTLDILGPCGKIECPRGQNFKCYKMVERQYYFQLVLEDSFAEDYVTEKLVKVLQHVTIPIVLGGADYNSFLPPGAFINVQAFDLKKLGAIIDYLIKNPKMYEYFFDWMNHYYYNKRPRNYICDLCTKLNENVEEYSSYNQFRHWWNADYQDICQSRHLYNMFTKDNL